MHAICDEYAGERMQTLGDEITGQNEIEIGVVADILRRIAQPDAGDRQKNRADV